MSKRDEAVSQVLSKISHYTKNLKQNAGNQPMQSSQTVITHDSNQQYEYPYSYTSSAAFHKSKSKKQSLILSREVSPKNMKNKHKSKEKDAFNMSCKYPQLKKDFQSQNERESNNFNRTDNKGQIKHLANLLNGSMGSKQFINKKSGHSYTYTHLNDVDSDKFSQIDNSFFIKPQQKISKFRHSKSPSKQRHIEHNNTSYADQNYAKISFINYKQGPQKIQSEKKLPNIDVGSLFKQINRLEKVIESYQSVLLRLKHSYLELQDKLTQKLLNDHYLDVLKKHIEDLEDKNSNLNLVINNQKEYINKFESLFVVKLTQIRQYFQQKVNENIQLSNQNIILKKILLISLQKPTLSNTSQPVNPPAQPQSAFLGAMTKNMEQFLNKWR